MAQATLVEQVQKLKQALEEIEKLLPKGDIPLAILEDFEMAVDHTRMTVWAMLSAQQSDSSELTAQIARFRIKRMLDMCHQIVMDIDGSQVTIETPELQPLHATLKDTVTRIDRLYKSGM